MFALEWYVYPIIGGVVTLSVLLAMIGHSWWEDSRYDEEAHEEHIRSVLRQELATWSGECGAWIGRETDGQDLLCEHLANHEGAHGLLSDEYDR